MQIQQFSNNNTSSQNRSNMHYNYGDSNSPPLHQSMSQQNQLQRQPNNKNQDEEFEQKRYLYEKYVEKLVDHLKFSDESDRKFIAKSYRKINELLTIKSCNNFFLSSNSKLIPQKVLKHAFNIKCFNSLQKSQQNSLVCYESFAGKRRCSIPILLKNYARTSQNQLQNKWQKLKSQDGLNYVIHQSNRFKLSIQSQPNSKIIYTEEQSLHPLLVKPQFRHQYMQKVDIQIIPPKKFNIIAIKPPYKIQSQVISLEVKKSKFTTNEINSFGYGYNYQRDLNHGGMIRPEETFDHDLSNSHEGDGSTMNGHYFSIQPELYKQNYLGNQEVDENKFGKKQKRR